MEAKWKRLTYDNLPDMESCPENKVFVARRNSDGKSCVGHIKNYNDRSIVIQNGNYETTLWFSEPRMFIMFEVPLIPTVTIGDRVLV